MGFIAMLVCAVGLGSVLVFWEYLPVFPRTFGDGLPLMTGLALVIGLLVGWAIRLVRARSLALPWASALYATAAVPLGWIGGSAPYSRPVLQGGRADPLALTVDDFLNGLPYAAQSLWRALTTSWEPWAPLPAAAIPAFVLVLARALRMRRGTRAAAKDASKDGPVEAQPEPEYRAPFEPAQSTGTPVPPVGDLFAPRKPSHE
ncbi:hypothetical protein [Nonomuraea sp. NPDC048916]|uniref:hypothetical protein n=1 Tax=Nonomuraea sp. NPDC048916 TaxID=3154232 RepID=UPI0033CD54B7